MISIAQWHSTPRAGDGNSEKAETVRRNAFDAWHNATDQALTQYRCDCLKKAVFSINDPGNALRKIKVDDYSTSEASDKSMQEYGGRDATNRDFPHPEGCDCMIRQEKVRTGTTVDILGDSTCFLCEYTKDDMAAAKAAWDEKYFPDKKFNETTGKMTRTKSSSFEKAWTWQPFLANACSTEHVGTPH